MEVDDEGRGEDRGERGGQDDQLKRKQFFSSKQILSISNRNNYI